MEIITAEQARKLTDEYISYDLENTIKYVMKKIKDQARIDINSIEFNNLISSRYINFKQLKNNNFIKYIESLGYNYNFYSKPGINFYIERIIISW